MSVPAAQYQFFPDSKYGTIDVPALYIRGTRFIPGAVGAADPATGSGSALVSIPETDFTLNSTPAAVWTYPVPGVDDTWNSYAIEFHLSYMNGNGGIAGEYVGSIFVTSDDTAVVRTLTKVRGYDLNTVALTATADITGATKDARVLTLYLQTSDTLTGQCHTAGYATVARLTYSPYTPSS